MSDTSRNRPERHTDRPEGVADPLLWGLALDVADAHQPDSDGTCRSLLYAGRAWPCEPWHRAQQALHLAQGSQQHWSAGAEAGPATQTGWSDEVPSAARNLRSAVPQQGRREAGSSASAA